MDYAIKVVQKNGNEAFVCDALGKLPTCFPSRAAAQRQADEWKIGLGESVQSIKIVKYPK
jgi:hypothetical protein